MWGKKDKWFGLINIWIMCKMFSFSPSFSLPNSWIQQCLSIRYHALLKKTGFCQIHSVNLSTETRVLFFEETWFFGIILCVSVTIKKKAKLAFSGVCYTYHPHADNKPGKWTSYKIWLRVPNDAIDTVGKTQEEVEILIKHLFWKTPPFDKTSFWNNMIFLYIILPYL